MNELDTLLEEAAKKLMVDNPIPKFENDILGYKQRIEQLNIVNLVSAYVYKGIANLHPQSETKIAEAFTIFLMEYSKRLGLRS